MTKASGRRSRRPTMVDVAREAGVALSTVSRVVNADPTVGAEFARRVQTAIDTLGYRPDEQAQQLRRGTSRTIGVAVREMSARNPLMAEFERGAYASGLTVFAASTADDEERERAVVLSMARRGFDGVLVEPIGPDHSYLAPEMAAGLAVVAIDRPIAGPATDAVLADNAAGIRMAYRQLADHGHTSIAYIGDHERIFTARERADAFRACLRADGRPVTGMVHPGETEQARISEALRAVLSTESPATALVCGNVTTTFGVLTHLAAEVPRDRRPALVGFDDFPLAGLLDPPMTVIAQDSPAMAHAALELMTARLAEPERGPEWVTVPVRLVARGSGERAPVR
ncbi:LacI family DNA-binding transcriptional regulator [Catenulispora pinisilvae]|uniref:LacI family DNA-binding transcriptional regulator n=1 Tax=Catenulispora pinisilvae TaxID=2705253 RepID=UPI001890BBFB|nr:LacI family DNA-binding transcriptional regulator [Catenulispora pinisilvae]